MAKETTQTRPSVDFHKPASGELILSEIEQFIENRKNQPISRAFGNFYEFVNSCVGNPDFRHPQSESLLSFLLIVREHLLDGLNENWTLDDILQPIVDKVESLQRKEKARFAAKKLHEKTNAAKEEIKKRVLGS